jgi:hypothetical protein
MVLCLEQCLAPIAAGILCEARAKIKAESGKMLQKKSESKTFPAIA